MGKIKSALELAMEKTADLKADKQVVKKNTQIREGRVSASQYMDNPANADLKEKLKSLKGEELEWFKTGAAEAFLANLTLPRIEADVSKLPALSDALGVLTGKKKEIEEMFGQLEQLFTQYLSNLDHLEESLKKQYEPQLRQKELKMRQQTGQSVQLTPEQDPEFLQLLSDQMSRMDQQYNEVLKQAKDQLKQGMI
ncbi:hypothetical protein EXM22_12875 [Oceanispirochaeta crateris]|jgi:hypothetical protein|uniref:Uncharacterized protein n=1 Tax=Oceanispirochaeta crateris TaxID=2518645 RepID=A0A5C1QMF5_9SPIO|nr:DUF6657 family protein [Oceanispirochaeta crateris]QEN08841.1 hypothetical protein EXM22_12875 [Oceanispirochaeta crateris]